MPVSQRERCRRCPRQARLEQVKVESEQIDHVNTEARLNDSIQVSIEEKNGLLERFLRQVEMLSFTKGPWRVLLLAAAAEGEGGLESGVSGRHNRG